MLELLKKLHKQDTEIGESLSEFLDKFAPDTRNFTINERGAYYGAIQVLKEIYVEKLEDEIFN